MNSQTFPLYFETYGKPKHPCIILITGIGAQLIHWPKKFIEALTNKGFYVLIFDNRDSGLSRHYDHLGVPGLMGSLYAKLTHRLYKQFYGLEDMAADVLMLMNKLSIQKATILGISMGGMIAQLIALQYPTRVSSLILIGTSSGEPWLPAASPDLRQLFSLSSFYSKETLQDYVDNKIRLFKLYNPYFFDEEKTRALHKTAYERAYTPGGVKRQLLAIVAAKARGESLKKLQVKTLILHGRVDPVFPTEHARFLAACIPQSRLEIIEKMGHLIPDELCEDIVGLI